MTGAMPLPGVNYLAVTVQSVNGNQAWVRTDQAGGQAFPVRRDFLRAKSPLPQPGEQWMIERPYGTDGWVFSMILGGDVQAPMLVVADAAARVALTAKYPGMAVYQLSSRSAWSWDGTAWTELVSAAITALQAQVAAMPKGLIAITRRATDITCSGTGLTLMESALAQVTAGRSYEVVWSCNQASSLSAGPPNASVGLVSAPNAVTAASPAIRSGGIRVYNVTAEIIELTETFDATATEIRAFGTVASPNSASATITFNGGAGRFLSVKDIGLTPS